MRNTQDAELPLASRLIFESRDLLAARTHLSRFLWSHSVIPVDRRPRVAFRHCAANIGRVSINALHYGAAVKIDAVPDDSYLARHGLENAAATGRSVTEIAQSCGFNHPGKFAKCYRARFGESPSDSRKRSLSSIKLAD